VRIVPRQPALEQQAGQALWLRRGADLPGARRAAALAKEPVHFGADVLDVLRIEAKALRDVPPGLEPHIEHEPAVPDALLAGPERRVRVGVVDELEDVGGDSGHVQKRSTSTGISPTTSKPSRSRVGWGIRPALRHGQRRAAPRA